MRFFLFLNAVLRVRLDLLKKIRDTKGTFHAKMGSIKDRNCMDLTEADGSPLQYFCLENPMDGGS